ncbi:MAG TPA: ABC transporter substrate-binding protein [Casimicrobiaceae bacterium]|nr:ABC transporter substrate-binding protein [Casimicrobiaceae bacterium]
MNNRRKLIVALGAGALAAPLASIAQQQGKVWRVGFLYFGSLQSSLDSGRYNAFLQGMRERGYIEGQNLVLETRFADGKAEALPGLAAELIRKNVDVIVATGTPVNRVLHEATVTVPIVSALSSDLVGDGFVKSLAHPGGNITGLTDFAPEIGQKHVELLIACVPALSQLAVLVNPSNPGHPGRLKLVEAATQKVAIHVLSVEAGTADGITRGFSAMARDRAQAVLILSDGFFLQQSRQIAELALEDRLPSISLYLEHAEGGGLMSYGPNTAGNFRRAAAFVDKILKGAKPSDLPVEQATEFELVVNMKTAKALGIKIPDWILAQATRVIE